MKAIFACSSSFGHFEYHSKTSFVAFINKMYFISFYSFDPSLLALHEVVGSRGEVSTWDLGFSDNLSNSSFFFPICVHLCLSVAKYLTTSCSISDIKAAHTSQVHPRAHYSAISEIRHHLTQLRQTAY